MNDIESWLRQHDLAKFADKFAENEIKLGDLSELTDEDVRDLGLPIGPRRRLQKAIRELVEDGPSEREDEDSTSQPKAEAEHRQLTVMFCDLVGSTALSEAMDTEDYRELLGAYQTAATSAIRNHDGYIARYMGDEAFIALNRLAASVLEGGEDVAQIFRVELRGECRRADQITEHHGQLAALRFSGWQRRGHTLL
jgi:class 3 adenylate cyclase